MVGVEPLEDHRAVFQGQSITGPHPLQSGVKPFGAFAFSDHQRLHPELFGQRVGLPKVSEHP